MTGAKLLSTFAPVLILAAAPSAVTLSASSAVAQASPPGLLTGRSASRMHHRAKRTSPGSYTNGKPDGASTGSRKQTPTGGNPGEGDHS